MNKKDVPDSITSYYKMADKYPLLDREEEVDLGEKIQSSNGKDIESINKMVSSNLKLVIKIAQDFSNQYTDTNDLICEGNLGLIIAAKRYDPEKFPDVKFSTYAAGWIKASMRRFALEKNRLIRIPLSTVSKLNKLDRAKEEYEHQNGTLPSIEELSEETGMSPEVISKLSDCPRYLSSLDEQLQEGDDSERGELVADEDQMRHLKDPQEFEHKMILMKHIDSLPERDKAILTYRFGLDGNGRRTLNEVAQIVGRTRERVRQLQCQILEKLRIKFKEDGVNQFEI